MARPALRIDVSSKDQKALRKLLSGGVQQVRVVLRALALLQLANGVAAPRIAGMIPLTPQAIRNVARRYQQGGLDRALYERQRPGAAEVLDESQKQRLIAMVCSSPPEGRARWTVRLVAEEAVKRKLVPQEATTIHLVLDNLHIHRRKSLTGLFGVEFGSEIWDRFTVHYTPTHGSWLNQAEIEIGLFTRQCLGRRRIPDLKTLRRESRAWNRRVNRARTQINGRFDRKTARRKFGYKRQSFKRSQT